MDPRLTTTRIQNQLESKLIPLTGAAKRQFNKEKIIEDNKRAYEIEQEAQKLKEISIDIHTMVSDQGYRINIVEQNIFKAKENVGEGERELQEADDYLEKSSCCIL
jgi:t-SNARE complex subunit (syntaxin)